MIERYSFPEMAGIWTEESRLKNWLAVEVAIVEAWAKTGVVPRPAAEKIRKKARFTVSRVKEIEREVSHDVIAFVKAVTENLGSEGKYLHFGVTSYDVVDTALSLQLRASAVILLKDVHMLLGAVRRKIKKHRHTLMMGRTHGVHAEPITFGFKLAVWHEELKRHVVRLQQAKEDVSFGKISGAVGTHAFVPFGVESYVCKKLGLKPAPVSTQILQRDRHAYFVCSAALLASSLEKFATEIRNLQRTEVREVEEYFAKGQRGSSAMPHKKNPILCERITGLARLVRSSAITAMENIPLWHERDLTNSAPERFIFPQVCILTDYLLRTFAQVVEKLVVYPERMRRNVQLSQGVISSQNVMLKLIEKGMSREEAYTRVQKAALEAWEEEGEFQALLLKDNRISGILSRDEIRQYTNPEIFVKNTARILRRLRL